MKFNKVFLLLLLFSLGITLFSQDQVTPVFKSDLTVNDVKTVKSAVEILRNIEAECV